MTFTLHAACGRLDAEPAKPLPLLQTPTVAGEFDYLGNCKHLAANRDGTVCRRCGQDVGQLPRSIRPENEDRPSDGDTR